MITKFRKVNKLLDIIASKRYYDSAPVENISVCMSGYKSGHTPPLPENFAPYTMGEVWADNMPDRHAWFHFELNIDRDLSEDPLQLQLNSCGTKNIQHPQYMIYVNGKLCQGLDANHTYYTFFEKGHYDIYLYAYTGRLNLGGSQRTSGISRSDFNVGFVANTRRVNTKVNGLYYDIKVPFDALVVLDPNSMEYARILEHLYNAVSLIDIYLVGSPEFFASLENASKYMRDEFYGKYCGVQPSTVACIGHTHIDCAWLWTLQQTREKVQRSFSTVIELMKLYPEYKFTSSQPLLYKMLKEEAPELYEEVKRLVAEGRWECEGSMWVEADCNIPSGESLVRQIIYGKRFFKEEFGKDNRILWLPDVFGYSAAMPQILKKSGVDWFVTSKIAWNETNTMPFETFTWQGIDGTEVSAYLLTSKDANNPQMRITYNGHATPNMLAGTYDRYTQKALSDEAIIPYGYGDGGGGPTAEFLEAIKREEKGIPGLPNARPDFLGNFFGRLEKKIAQSSIPKWRGELYLEYHRGTYTSVAKNKKNNRKSEFLFLDAELMGVLGKLIAKDSFPKQELRRGWESILTNQFHDIIPGSSIGEVYEQSDRDYSEIQRIGGEIRDGVQEKIAASLDSKLGYAVFNPHSFTRPSPVSVNGKTAIVSGIPPKGYKAVKDFCVDNRVKIDISARTAETELYEISFDEHWQICRLYDKVNRKDVLAHGKVGNELRIYADVPDKYEAWEWCEYSLDSYKPLTALESVETVDDGARRGIRVVRSYNLSRLTQTVWLYDSLERIEFDTHVDWHERNLMLKAAFPVNVNSDRATYEIQFGTVERPTHKNTSWDRAKFEVCAHKYADLSDNGYGVAIINDCKYGHDIHDGVMQLSLLRCPTYPYPDADQGESSFTYAICPHKGTLADSDVALEAYTLNYPLSAVRATADACTVPEEFSVLSIDSDHVICETVKEAEADERIVLRLYEHKNISDVVELKLGFDVEEAYICDLLENEQEALTVRDGRRISLPIRGFDIVTVKVQPR